MQRRWLKWRLSSWPLPAGRAFIFHRSSSIREKESLGQMLFVPMLQLKYLCKRGIHEQYFTIAAQARVFCFYYYWNRPANELMLNIYPLPFVLLLLPLLLPLHSGNEKAMPLGQAKKLLEILAGAMEVPWNLRVCLAVIGSLMKLLVAQPDAARSQMNKRLMI